MEARGLQISIGRSGEGGYGLVKISGQTIRDRAISSAKRCEIDI